MKFLLVGSVLLLDVISLILGLSAHPVPGLIVVAVALVGTYFSKSWVALSLSLLAAAINIFGLFFFTTATQAVIG